MCRKATIFSLVMLLLITAIVASVEVTSGISWSADIYQLTTDTHFDGMPSITQANDGRIWVVWSKPVGGYYALFYKTSSDMGETWSEEMNLTAVLGEYDNTKPSITQTTDGKIWVVWASNKPLPPQPPEPHFILSASPDSLTIAQDSSDTSIISVTSVNDFSDPVELTVLFVPENVTTIVSPPEVTPPPNGTVNSTLTVTVEPTATPGNYTLVVKGRSEGNSAGDTVSLALEITESSGVSTAAPSHLLSLSESSDWEIYYRTSTDNGATWSDIVQLTDNSADDLSPSITQVTNGTIFIVWQSILTGDYELFYKTSPNSGASWSEPLQLTDDPDRDTCTSITQTQDGRLWVTWSSSRTGYDEIFYKIHNGTSWSDDTQLTDSARIDSDPKIMETMEGATLIFWTSCKESPTATDDIYYKYSANGGVDWTDRIQFTTDADNDLWASATQMSNLKIWVVWTSDRTGNYDLFYKTSLHAELIGPEIDQLRFKVIKSPDPQLIAMQTCAVDVLTDLIRTGDIDKLTSDGFTVTSAPGFHMGFIGFNTRPDQSYKDPAHGSPTAGPVLGDANFRHACFHCYNQAEIVASIYKHIVTPVQSLVPPTQGGWLNPAVPTHPYNPGDPEGTTVYNPATQANADACSILRYGGYTYDPGEGNWLTPYDLDGMGGNDYIPELSVFTPTYEVAPTSAEHGARFVTDCNAVGIPLVHEPRELKPYLELVYGTTGLPGGEFDLYMHSQDLGRFPDHLYAFCHSSQDTRIRPGAYNGVGVNNTDLDAAVETVKFSLNHAEKLDAAHDAQEMLYDPDNYPECGCAYMLLYSRIYFNGFKPGLEGIVNSPGYGSDNIWTFLNMRWEPGHSNERLEDGNSTVIWCLGETPERLNPLFGHTAYAWEVMGTLTDGLIAANPYTNQDVPWLATHWTMEAPTNETLVLDSNWYIGYNETAGERILYKSAGETYDIVDGMKIIFTLRTDVTWHDGNPYTVDDAEFSLEFIRNNQIPRYTSTWENIVDVQVTANSVAVYVNETGQFSVYDFASVTAMLPPPVWTHLDGRPLPEILAYDPANNLTKPTGAGPRFGTDDCPTQLYGTGPFIFEFYDPVEQYTELHANRKYWKSTFDVETLKTEMFHAVGDVDRNGEIWSEDRLRYSLAYGCTSGEISYNADADLNGDGIVDALDGILINFYWGDKREYP